MTKHLIPDFIVIDDDPINNMICQNILEYTYPEAIVRTFTEPEEGLEFLSMYGNNELKHAIVFLDINMPTISGWEILDKFSLLPDTLKARVKIYMLSSSFHHDDIEKANDHPLVSGYVIKTLTPEKLNEIFVVV